MPTAIYLTEVTIVVLAALLGACLGLAFGDRYPDLQD